MEENKEERERREYEKRKIIMEIRRWKTSNGRK